MNHANNTVLLVEDDPIITAALSERLSEADYNVHSFATAEKALQALDDLAPQLVITDVRLPGTDGIELLKQLKQRDPSLSVIVMTGYATVSDAVAAMKLGAADYLPKPVSAEEVALKLAKIMFETSDKERGPWYSKQPISTVPPLYMRSWPEKSAL